MKRTLLAIMTTLALLLSPAHYVAAQPDETDSSFTSALSGAVIDLGSSGEITFLPQEYEISRGRLVSEEYIWFTYGWSNFELVLIGGENDAAEYSDLTIANMFAFYDRFEIVAEEITISHAWFIAHAEYQGSPMVVSYDFQLDALGEVDLVVMQFTDANELATDLAFVQAEVTIGGNPMLPDVDGPLLQSLVTDSEPTTATPDASAEPSIGSLRVRARLAGTVGTPGVDVSSPTPTIEATVHSADGSATAVTGRDWESMGLVSDTEWVSPSLGTILEWDGAVWAFPIDYEYAIYINDDPAYESVTLETTDGLGYVFVTVEEVGQTTPASLAEWWASPGYEMTFEAGITTVEISTSESTASIVYETVNTLNEPLYVVLTATFLADGTLVYSQISAAPDTIHEVYGQYVNGVQVNGAPVELTYTVDEIIEMSGN